jgi:hypothetical protein
MGFLMNDGTELEVGPSEAFDVQPGHDAWVIGNSPVVFIDMIGAVKDTKAPLDPRRSHT